MTQKTFSIYDFVVYSVKSVLNNFRLFFLSTLVFFASLILFSVGVGGLIAKTANKELFNRAAWLQLSAIQKISFFFANINILVFVLSLLILVFFIIGLASGYMKICFDLYEKRESKVSRIFSQFHRAPKIAAAFFLLSIICTLGLILFIIPGLILGFRLRYSYYFILDKNCGIIESLKKSYEATRGLTWELFGLYLVSIVMGNFLSVFIIPIMFMMEAAVYKHLSK